MASTNITGLGVLEPIPRGQDMIGSSVYTYSEAKAVGGEGGWVGGAGDRASVFKFEQNFSVHATAEMKMIWCAGPCVVHMYK